MTKNSKHILEIVHKLEDKYGSIENADKDDPDLIKIQKEKILGDFKEENNLDDGVYAHIGAIKPDYLIRKPGLLPEKIAIEIELKPDISAGTIATRLGRSKSSVASIISRNALRSIYYQVILSNDRVLRAKNIRSLAKSTAKFGYDVDYLTFEKEYNVEKHIITRQVRVRNDNKWQINN